MKYTIHDVCHEMSKLSTRFIYLTFGAGSPKHKLLLPTILNNSNSVAMKINKLKEHDFTNLTLEVGLNELDDDDDDDGLLVISAYVLTTQNIPLRTLRCRDNEHCTDIAYYTFFNLNWKPFILGFTDC